MSANSLPAWQQLCEDEAASIVTARVCAALLQPGDCFYLHGDLGAGKTTWVRALVHALGYQGRVTSPTYAFVNGYECPDFMLYHMDLYRLNGADDCYEIGLETCFSKDSVCCVEWPENGAGFLDPADISLSWQVQAATLARRMTWHAESARGEQLLLALQAAIGAKEDNAN